MVLEHSWSYPWNVQYVSPYNFPVEDPLKY